MSISRYDIAIVGDSLAARLAAPLLAKQGRRVLHLTSPAYHDPWPQASFCLDQLLVTLGGELSRSACHPIQVLSAHARVTIHPERPLADELTREFASAAAPVAQLLDRLERTGRLLEELLRENGGLPAGGMRAAATWRWQCLRRKLPLADLTCSLVKYLQGLAEPAAPRAGAAGGILARGSIYN